MENTLVDSCIAIGNESRSSLAATIRQGTSKPVSSPWLAISTRRSEDALHEDSSDLKQKSCQFHTAKIIPSTSTFNRWSQKNSSEDNNSVANLIRLF
jgi:hypothetical protein